MYLMRMVSGWLVILLPILLVPVCIELFAWPLSAYAYALAVIGMGVLYALDLLARESRKRHDGVAIEQISTGFGGGLGIWRVNPAFTYLILVLVLGACLTLLAGNAARLDLPHHLKTRPAGRYDIPTVSLRPPSQTVYRSGGGQRRWLEFTVSHGVAANEGTLMMTIGGIPQPVELPVTIDRGTITTNTALAIADGWIGHSVSLMSVTLRYPDASELKTHVAFTELRFEKAPPAVSGSR